MKHCMVDLETLGTSSDAAIISIGAVGFHFNPAIELSEKFYEVIDVQSAIDRGGRVDGATLQWWVNQSGDARTVFSATNVHVDNALMNFALFYRNNGFERIWAKPSSFDIPILESAFRRSSVKTPWSIRDVRDVRTFLDTVGAPKREHSGVAHHALDDAITQAQDIQNAAMSTGRK